MKISNSTHWRTDQIKALIYRVAQDELDGGQSKGLYVEVVYRKPNWNRCGLGTIRALWMRLYLDRDNLDPVQLAHTIAHEFAHNRGMHHKDMKGSLRYDYVDGWREYYGWAAAMPVEKKALKVKAKPDVQLTRYQRVIEAEKRWAAKLKRAQTALKKLASKRRYYERALTAAGKLEKK